MALTRSNKLWMMAIIYLILMVALADWLEYHCHNSNKHSIKQTDQYENKK